MINSLPIIHPDMCVHPVIETSNKLRSPLRAHALDRALAGAAGAASRRRRPTRTLQARQAPACSLRSGRQQGAAQRGRASTTRKQAKDPDQRNHLLLEPVLMGDISTGCINSRYSWPALSTGKARHVTNRCQCTDKRHRILPCTHCSWQLSEERERIFSFF